MEIRVISDWDELLGYVSDWKDLVEAAIEPNPFYEDWMLLPALRNLGRDRDLSCILVFHKADNSSLLCGLFPIERQGRYLGLPVSAFSIWKYAHCFLTLPLLRRGHEAECLAAIFEWLHSTAGCHLLEWRQLPGDGVSWRHLAHQLSRSGTVPFLSELYPRAFFRPMNTADQYFSAALSGKHRKALRRRAELLSELGRVECTIIGPDADIQYWIDNFLRTEAGGWKGKEGSAFACQESHRQFFTEVIMEAFRRGNLLMTALVLDGVPIAQNCYFRTGRAAFHFKPTFDEEYARFSPGFHLECETIRHLHTRSDIDSMDSCAAADNEMYNRLFVDRRVIQSQLIPVAARGRSLLAVLPLLKLVKHSIAQLRSHNQNAKTPDISVPGRPETRPAERAPEEALR